MNYKKHALVCLPSDALNQALRMKDLGSVDIAKARRQHQAYCQALSHLGFTLITMLSNSQYPDSVFVEDPAVVIKNILVITRLRREERQGEENLLKEFLTPFFSRVLHIEAPGFIEGGDVLVTDDRLYIGLSKRTNAEGAEQLAKIARDNCGYLTEIFEVPKHYLHIKGGSSFHRVKNTASGKMIIASEEIAHHFSNSGCQVVVTPAEERFGANGISENGQIIIHANRVKTKKILEKVGFSVYELLMSEFEKIDGALSCLSKLFKNPKREVQS